MTRLPRAADWVASLADTGSRIARRIIPRGGLLWRTLRGVRQRLPRRGPDWFTPGFILEFARAYPNAHFVQIGSNDGQQQDPLCAVIEAFPWQGILVEPVPYVFARLKAHRAGHPGLILENVAVAAEPGTMPFYYLPASDDPALPRWYNALGSFRREVVERHAYRIPDIKERIETLQVPCLTFEQLCSKHGFEQIDLIHTDVEGYDWTLIQSIDLKRYRPVIFIYEHHHQDPDTRLACRQHMEQHGYSLLAEGLDTLAVQRDKLPPGLARRFDRYRERVARAA